MSNLNTGVYSRNPGNVLVLELPAVLHSKRLHMWINLPKKHTNCIKGTNPNRGLKKCVIPLYLSIILARYPYFYLISFSFHFFNQLHLLI
jgi:hypothetical protein